ncbi:hypothetical protein [Pseudoalteromonas shioyasakiensis]|uniref:hypothetical protein n=1 Tax=Pseudoalteromonas shioyasakiensis TaxID=1190813 RepID=UPI001C3E44FD|nr:hypothetical protein [Pseudoalteromonas shioyasakiensis]
MNIYDRTQIKIIEAGFNTENIKDLVHLITQCTDISEAKKLLTEFEVLANKLPWPQDHDFGALLIQKEYKSAISKSIEKLMISTAHERAHWCASCSTSGGEGLARSVHVKELSILLQNCI